MKGSRDSDLAPGSEIPPAKKHVQGFDISCVLILGMWGAVTGDWTGASRRSYAFSWAGIVILNQALNLNFEARR